EGRHVATTSEKTVDQLPALVRKTVKTKFQGKEVTNMVQYTTDSEDAYFVEVVDHGKTKIFRVGSNGSASRFK
ncbi:MAG TPA: hypothetical protein VK907_11690, partial [Phnomibacter sp.]|nr:hypothetical protein [Phnomibacter sp.]